MKNNKMILKVIILILLVLGVILSITLNNRNNIKENTDAIKFKETYESLNGKKTSSGNTYPKVTLNDNNPFVYKSAKEIVETLKNGTGLIYLGFPNCPWCRNSVNVLQYVNTNEILYLDVTDHRDSYEVIDGELTKTKEGTKEYYEILELLDSILTDYEVDGLNTNEKRIYVPLVVGVKDGKIVGYHADTVDLDEGQTPYDLLTDKQQNELKLIYDEINAKVSGDTCDLDPNHGC